MLYTSRVARKYKTHVTVRDVRRVWQAVTREPQSSTRALGRQLNIAHNRVGAALRMLKDAGYIDFPTGAERARSILIPFYTQEPE